MADFQAMIKTELIGKDLMATVQKMNGATCYAIIPKTLKDDSGLGLDEAIDQIAGFVQGITKSATPPFTAKNIQEALAAFVDISKVKLVLRQAYMFIKKHQEESTEGETGTDIPNPNDITEYAFNIAVLMEEGEFEQTEGSLFKVKELSFAVWSCNRQVILDTMDILDLSDIDKAIEHAAMLAKKDETASALMMSGIENGISALPLKAESVEETENEIPDTKNTEEPAEKEAKKSTKK